MDALGDERGKTARSARHDPIKPLEHRRPIFLQIAEELTTRIRTGRYLVGERLPGELELSRDFAASRASVREALSALQFTGYIEPRQGSGTIVRSASPHDAGTGPVRLSEVIDLLELRSIVEPAAVALTATEGRAATVRGVQHSLAGMTLVLDHAELQARTDISVHLELARACPNRLVAREVETVLLRHAGPVWHRIREQTWTQAKDPKNWLGHHQRLLEAVANREAETAVAICRDHLASVLETVTDGQGLPASQRLRATRLAQDLRCRGPG
ncbi:MAG: FadR/GntR family transcriptional regulator [Acidimicrobiales bacterium]